MSKLTRDNAISNIFTGKSEGRKLCRSLIHTASFGDRRAEEEPADELSQFLPALSVPPSQELGLELGVSPELEKQKQTKVKITSIDYQLFSPDV